MNLNYINNLWINQVQTKQNKTDKELNKFFCQSFLITVITILISGVFHVS
jgi:hypothetical protein